MQPSMKIRWSTASILAALAVTLASLAPQGAAATRTAMTPERAASPTAVDQDDELPPINDDEQLTRIGERFPGFAGHVIDDTQTKLLVRSTRSFTAAELDDLQQELAALDGRWLGDLALEVVPVDYEFTRLNAWYESLASELLALPGVVMSDIDERRNRLVIGVEAPALHAQAVLTLVSQIGIPSDAVTVEAAEPVRTLSSLRDQHRPLVGGLQIGTIFYACSLGVSAFRPAGPADGLVTNSHCTDRRNGVEDTEFGQPTVDQLVARETVDPPMFRGGDCPNNRRCRGSDAAFLRLTSGVDRLLGRVARPGSGVNWNGSNVYEIAASGDGLTIGTAVFKVGRTSGESQSSISGRCVDYNVAESNITMLCESRARGMTTRAGDSGAPVLGYGGVDGAYNRRLVGILWGGGGVFSPWGHVENELGNMSVCAVSAC